MGGIGSGRWGGKPTVGGGLSLDLNDLLRNGSLKRNATTTGVLTWPGRSGEQVARIGYRATLGSERGDLWLRWATADPSTGRGAGARAVDRAASSHSAEGDGGSPATTTSSGSSTCRRARRASPPAATTGSPIARSVKARVTGRSAGHGRRGVAWIPSATSAALVSSRNGCVGTPSTA
jgi:hypothetical protein